MTPTKKAPAVKTHAKGSTARGNGSSPATPARAAAATSPAGPAKAAKRTAKVAETVKVAETAETAGAPATKAAAASPAGRSRTAAAPAAAKAPARKAAAPVAAKAPSRTEAKPASTAGPGPYASDAKFLTEQQALLEHERAVYQGQAADLKAEADSLAQEREPGDVQFDEESGEGGTVTVDRERDLALSAQALAAVDEIDEAALRITARTYGACERCHQPIPKLRLRALPYARLCVACKSGGLSRR